MEKSSNFFLIHNYNTIPDDLIARCENHLIMDASDDPAVRTALQERKDLHIRQIENTGHNLTSYFLISPKKRNRFRRSCVFAKAI